MRLVGIHMAGNEHGQLRRDTIYAKLVEDDGSIVISATLEYILAAIRDKGYEVEGVAVERYTTRAGVECTETKLVKYEL